MNFRSKEVMSQVLLFSVQKGSISCYCEYRQWTTVALAGPGLCHQWNAQMIPYSIMVVTDLLKLLFSFIIALKL